MAKDQIKSDTGLSLARKKAGETRAQLAEGVDPSAHRKGLKEERERQQQAAQESERLDAAGLPQPGSLEAVAGEWL